MKRQGWTAFCALVGFVASGSPALAQDRAGDDLGIPDVHYPSLPARATSVEGFDVPGWKIERAVWGEFDTDGYEDLALVLRAEDPANVIANPDGLGEDPYDTNPRILAVAMGDENGFRLVAQNHDLIVRRDSPTMVDPFTSISVTNTGALVVNLELFLSAGGWTAGTYSFTFRYQDEAMRLIGYDETAIRRNTGDLAKISVNLLTGRRSDATGRIETDEMQTVWSRTDLKPIPLEAIGNGFEFEQAKLTRPEHQ